MSFQAIYSQRTGMSEGLPLLVALLLMFGMTVAPATAQITDTTEQETPPPPTTTEAQQQAELSDPVILDVLMTINQAEIRTSEVVAGEQAGAPQQPPMETPPEEDMPPEQDTPPTDTMGAQQDTTMYGGEQQQDTAYADRPPMDEPRDETTTGPTTTGGDQSVQEFAQRMIEEHNQLNDRISQVSQDLGIQPESNLLSEVMQSTVEGVTEDLRQASQENLDQEYMLSQVVLHQQALNMLEHSLIPNAEDEEVANLLETARQDVEEHLEQARDIFLEIAQQQQMQPAE